MPTDELGNEFDNAPWRRKVDDPALPDVVPAPARHYYPTGPTARADLIEYVRLAEVRASGRHWSFSDAAVTHGVIVETNRPRTPPGAPPAPARPPMNRTLREVVPRAMTPEALRFFSTQTDVAFDPTKVPDHTRFYLYHVEAGTQIWELYCRLDAGDHNPDSLARRMQEASGKPDYLGPWAMPTLGGAGGQTIVGAFSTGTHGGDVHLPPIADAAQAIHLIGARGRQYWIERPLALGVWLADPDKLRIAYGEIEVIRDPKAPAAVAVACGRMGIIYSVVLRVVRQYALVEHRWEDRWSALRTWIHNPAHTLFTSHRFVSVVANPMGLPDDSSEHACYLTVRTLAPLDAAGKLEPRGRAQRCGANGGNSAPLLSEAGSFLNRVCASDSPVHAALEEIIDDTRGVQGKAAATGAVALLLGNVAAAAVAAAAVVALDLLVDAMEDLKATLPSGPLGRTIAVVGQWALDNDRMEVLRHISDYVVRDQHSLDRDNPVTAVSYALLDIHNYLDVGCSTSGDSPEVFFDVTTPAAGKSMVAFMDLFFQRVTELENGWLPKEGGGVTGTRMVFPGYCSLRFMSRSSALLALQKWSRVCSLEIAGFRAAAGTEPFLAAVERDAVRMGTAIHWGQRNNLRWKPVEKLYGAFFPTDPLARWRFWLSRLTENGRHPVFSTAFTRDRGLEVIEPRVGSFSVAPSTGCAGEPVRIEWEASQNPPGTTARLEIRPLSSSTPLSVIPLDVLEGPWDTLAGTRDVPLPVGRAEFHFIVEQALNQRAVTHSAIVAVRGFSDHDVWRFQPPARCVFLGGVARWSTRVSLAEDGVAAPAGGEGHLPLLGGRRPGPGRVAGAALRAVRRARGDAGPGLHAGGDGAAGSVAAAAAGRLAVLPARGRLRGSAPGHLPGVLGRLRPVAATERKRAMSERGGKGESTRGAGERERQAPRAARAEGPSEEALRVFAREGFAPVRYEAESLAAATVDASFRVVSVELPGVGMDDEARAALERAVVTALNEAFREVGRRNAELLVQAARPAP